MTAILVLILRLLMALALYAFLARAIYTIWRDLRAQTTAIGSRSVPGIAITRLSAPSDPPTVFTSAEVIVGRDSSCEYVLLNDTVSSRHARLSYHHNQWWVEDMQSTNGTYLNDERVATPIVIISGDELRCGQESLTLHIQAD